MPREDIVGPQGLPAKVEIKAHAIPEEGVCALQIGPSVLVMNAVGVYNFAEILINAAIDLQQKMGTLEGVMYRMRLSDDSSFAEIEYREPCKVIVFDRKGLVRMSEDIKGLIDKIDISDTDASISAYDLIELSEQLDVGQTGGNEDGDTGGGREE